MLTKLTRIFVLVFSCSLLSCSKTELPQEYEVSIPNNLHQEADVVVLFAYPCPHCYQMRSTLSQSPWDKDLHHSLLFKHAAANKTWYPFIKLEILFKRHNVLDVGRDYMFSWFHEQHKDFKYPDQAVQEILEHFSIPFSEYDSEETLKQFDEDVAYTNLLHLRAVPAIVVKNRFVFNASAYKTEEQLYKAIQLRLVQSRSPQS